MKTITEQLADALRRIVSDKGSAQFNDDLEAYDVAVETAREAIAAYDAQQAQPVPAGAWSANAGSVWDHTGKWVADCNRVNATRIVACVNACAGMTTNEVLEFGAPGELGRCAQAWVAEDNDHA